jgi:hypothetical protein
LWNKTWGESDSIISERRGVEKFHP